MGEEIQTDPDGKFHSTNATMDDVEANIQEYCHIPGEPDETKDPEVNKFVQLSESLQSGGGSGSLSVDSNANHRNHLQSNDKNNNNHNTRQMATDAKLDDDDEPPVSVFDKQATPELRFMATTPVPPAEADSKAAPAAVSGGEVKKTTSMVLVKTNELVHRLKWSNIFYLSVLHGLFVMACIHTATHPVKVLTVVAAFVAGFFSGMGMSVGAHRYWAHRSFKAHPFLRLSLMLLQTMTMNGSIFSYARDHRNHHKYSDTEADPKNPSRGLFHGHVGWWLWKKSPVVIHMGRKFDVTDLWNDPLINFQHRFYVPLFLLLNIVLPTLAPWLLWSEDPLTAFNVLVILRTTIVLHLLFCVNSVSHHYGYRPYDFRIRPADNRIINYLSMGEGNHNYHHVFPYDYRSNEKAHWEYFDPIASFLTVSELLGLAYDCKKASPRVIEGIVRRKGIPAHFDQPRSLQFRIANAVLDWVAGTIVTMWPLYPFILYKLATGQQLIYW